MAEKDFANFLAACRVYIRDLEYQSPSKDFRYSVVVPGARRVSSPSSDGKAHRIASVLAAPLGPSSTVSRMVVSWPRLPIPNPNYHCQEDAANDKQLTPSRIDVVHL